MAKVKSTVNKVGNYTKPVKQPKSIAAKAAKYR